MLASLERRYEIEFVTYFAADLRRLRPAIDNGLVTLEPTAIRATSRGRLLLRIIAMCFDRYLNETSLCAPSRFSRAS